MTTHTAVETHVLALVGDATDEQVHHDSAFLDDLGIDSLALVTVVEELGKAFDVAVPDDDLPSPTTVGDVIDAVSAQAGHRA